MASFETEATGVWRMLPSGRALQAAVNAELEEVLGGLFGYHLVSVGAFSNALDRGASPVLHQLSLGLDHASQLCAEPSALPLSSDSIDVVLLAQLLDFHDNPHRVLREAARVVIPEGSLVITGFNPASLWGLWRLLHWRDRRRGVRFLTPGRIKDWLKLLGFELVEERRFFFAPPLKDTPSGGFAGLESWVKRLVPRLGGMYLMVARKQVSALTPLRMAWTPKVIPIRPALADSGARVSAKNSSPEP